MIQNVQQAPWYGRQDNTVPRIPGVPVIPPLPEQQKYAAQCGECGVLIPNGPWLYSCPNGRCPIFPKVTC